MEKNEIIYTGFMELDKLTGGFKRGELILIAGRPAMGKTSFTLNIVQHVGINLKVPIVVFSLGKSKEQLVQHLICSNAEVDSKKLRFGNMQTKDWEKLVNTVSALLESPIYVDDTPGITVKEIEEKIKKVKPKVVFIDYFQLIMSNRKLDSIVQIEEIAKELKRIIKEYDIVMLIAFQLSRTLESRCDKRPILSDISSSAIKNLSDVIISLYRDEYYDSSIPEKSGTAEIIVTKNSDGKTGTINLLFDKEKTKFMNIEENVFIFDNILSININSFTAKLGDYWLESDLNGNLLYKIKCQNLRRISDDLLIAKANNKEGLIDNDFNVISGFKYSDFKTLDKNFQYFKFRKNKKWGVVDRQGTIIIEPKYSKLERADKNFNYMFVKVNDKEYLIDRHENIIDAETEDKLICTPDFIENIEHSINSNWRIVEINGKYGLVDKAFNQLKININNIAKILEKQINFFDRDSYTIEV